MCAQRPRRSPPPVSPLTALNVYFKPGRPTRPEEGVKGKTQRALQDLKQLREEARGRLDLQLEDSWQLQKEKSQVQAENRLFMEYLCRENEQCRKKHELLWKRHFQECWEMERKRQELASSYSQRHAHLQAQLARARQTHAAVEQQRQALRPVSLLKESQDAAMQTLEKEKEKIRIKIATKAREGHLRFLREKAGMEKHLEELRTLQLSTRELKRKPRTLALAAQQAHFQFCGDLGRQNQQLRKELQQLSQEYNKLEAARRKMEKKQKQMKEEQWYLEALMRGRQRLQAAREGRERRSSQPRVQPPSGPQIKRKTQQHLQKQSI